MKPVLLLTFCLMSFPAMPTELSIAGTKVACWYTGQATSIFWQEQEDPTELILSLDEATTNAEREQIIEKLKKLGAATLIALKNPPKGLGNQTKVSLSRVKFEIEQAINQQATKPSTFTLKGTYALSEALEKIESQTGIIIENKLVGKTRHDFDLNGVAFWKGFDQILDRFGADVFRSSTPSAIKVIKSSRSNSRSKLTSYSGIIRVEATNYFSISDFQGSGNSFDRIWLDVRWEPRLKPVELLVDYTSIEIVDGKGNKRRSLSTGAIKRPILISDSYKQLDLQIEKIPREITSIKSIRGKMKLKTRIGRKAFQFPKILGTKNKSVRMGETTVRVLSATYTNSDLKIGMQFEIDNPGDSLDSHQGWMFQNKAFLLDKKQNRILSDKIMTLSQEKNKMGFEFTFKNIDGPEGFDFVYESPTSIREIPLTWRVDNIELK